MGNLILDSTGSNPAHKGARALLGQPDVAEVITAQLFMWACRTIQCSNRMKGRFAGNTKAEKTGYQVAQCPEGIYYSDEIRSALKVSGRVLASLLFRLCL